MFSHKDPEIMIMLKISYDLHFFWQNMKTCQNYWIIESAFFPYNLIGQLNNGFSIRPNIACTQIW